MKVILHEDVKFEYSDLVARRKKRPVRGDVSVESTRSPGVHLSGVLRAYALNAEILTPSELDEESETVYPLRMAIGVAVEEFLASMYPEVQWWPGELSRDGVAGNPDGISGHIMSVEPKPFNRMLTVEEIKYTHMSCSNGRDVPNLASRQGVKDWWMRLNQAMGYCNLMRQDFLDEASTWPRHARYHVIYGCGDYVRPYKERYMRTLVEFGDRELEANWEMVRKWKHKAEREG